MVTALLQYRMPMFIMQQLQLLRKLMSLPTPEPYDVQPQYNYGYSVQDGLTGDSKNHQESWNGDVIQSQYSLVEPDGAVRTLTYTADSFNGFNAVVQRNAPTVDVAKTVAALIHTRTWCSSIRTYF